MRLNLTMTVWSVVFVFFQTLALASDFDSAQETALLEPSDLQFYQGFSCAEERVCRSCVPITRVRTITQLRRNNGAFEFIEITKINGVETNRKIYFENINCNFVAYKDARIVSCKILENGTFKEGFSTSTSKRSYIVGDHTYREDYTILNFSFEPDKSKNFSLELNKCRVNQ
jgi:hypothetical protein